MVSKCIKFFSVFDFKPFHARVFSLFVDILSLKNISKFVSETFPSLILTIVKYLVKLEII